MLFKNYWNNRHHKILELNIPTNQTVAISLSRLLGKKISFSPNHHDINVFAAHLKHWIDVDIYDNEKQFDNITKTYDKKPNVG